MREDMPAGHEPWDHGGRPSPSEHRSQGSDIDHHAEAGRLGHGRGRGPSFEFDREFHERGMGDGMEGRDAEGFPGRGGFGGRAFGFRGRGRSDFAGRGEIRGRGEPYIGGRGEFRGRGDDGISGRGFGRSGRGRWSDDAPFFGRGRGYEAPEEFGSFRGRGEPYGRGLRGRAPGRFEGRGRRGDYFEDGPRRPSIDPALQERRRASSAALLRHQLGQLQVSRDLVGEGEVLNDYDKIMGEGTGPEKSKLRSLYTYPLFSTEDNSALGASLREPSDQSQAFEQCLLMYREAQSKHVIVQSDHGNFLLPAADVVL